MNRYKSNVIFNDLLPLICLYGLHLIAIYGQMQEVNFSIELNWLFKA